MLPFQSLSSVSVPTVGAARDLEGIARHFTAVLELDGAVGDGSITTDEVFLRGSLDGTNWVPVGSANLSSSGSTGARAVSTPDNQHYVRYIRVDVDKITAGSVVSAWVVAADIQ